MKIGIRILILAIIALVGLAAVQIYLLKETFELKKETLERNIYLAMDEVAQDMTRDRFRNSMKEEFDTSLNKNTHVKIEINEKRSKTGYNENIEVDRKVWIQSDSNDGTLDTIVLREWSNKLLEEFIAEKRGLSKADLQTISSSLERHFKNYKLGSLPEFCIKNHKDSILLTSQKYIVNSSAGSEYSTPLFPQDLIKNPIYLVVRVSNTNMRTLTELLWPAILALLFILSTGVLFIVVLSRYKKQKQLADIRNDLINTMSHALKTPVST
ncbi:hypothetical protein GYB22_03140, partial [bacterium]|nr:hypothetical protein [bacterium]